MTNKEFENALHRTLGRECIKVTNMVSLSIGRHDKERMGFVIIDWSTDASGYGDGDIVTLPLGTRWKNVKDTFCLMNNYSQANTRRPEEYTI